MCHEWLTQRERRRQDRFDEELRYLLDEDERFERPAPVVEHETDVEPSEGERPRVEAGSAA